MLEARCAHTGALAAHRREIGIVTKSASWPCSSTRFSRLLVVVAVLATALLGSGMPGHANTSPVDEDAEASPPVDVAIATGVQHLLEMQEGDPRSEWPYEGVYRVRGQIPIGYRVGGTGICAGALVQAPGYADDEERQAAVARAVAFITGAIEHPLMAPEYDGGYDVRCWGYCFALDLLLRLQRLDLVPEGQAEAVERAVVFYLDGLHGLEIPVVGGWAYSRRELGAPSPASPFMTGPCLQVLFAAAQQGHAVDARVVERGLGVLERGASATGAIAYSVRSPDSGEPRDVVPGSVGRMLCAEATLTLGGRSSPARLRGAIDAFLVHWQWLDARRAQKGTHVAPYGVAPYYFYFAHHYAAQAIELLPGPERGEYRRRLRELLYEVRLPDGSWNDRVFPRTANYGTAMSVLALLMPELPTAPRWQGAWDAADVPHGKGVPTDATEERGAGTPEGAAADGAVTEEL